MVFFGIEMNKHIRVFFTLMAGAWLLSSCLGSDDETDLTYSSDTAILSFSLLTVNQYTTTNSTTTKKTLTTPVTFHIDQYQRKIYNTDSLPKGCDLKHVLVSVSAKSSATVVLKSVVGDTLSTFTSTDSLDFSQPRTLLVYALNGASYRSYEVTINKHQADVSTMIWEQVAVADFPTDTVAEKWAQAAEAKGLRFVGVGTKEAYAFDSEGMLMACSDLASEWQPDSIDDDRSLLPSVSSSFTTWNFEPTDSTDCHLMVGVSPVDSKHCVVWRKLAEYASTSEASKWTYIPVESFNRYALPIADHVSIAYYKGFVLAFSSDGAIYVSRDEGITWKKYDDIAYPKTGYSARVDAAVKGEFVYIRNKENGEVWRGYYIE